MNTSHNLLTWMAVAAGGAGGASLRFLVHSRLIAPFPFSTLLVNIAGCFMAGLFWQIVNHSARLPHATIALVASGFLGALTTFSTFGVETVDQLMHRGWFWAVGNVVANVCGGLLAVGGGWWLGTWFWPRVAGL